MKFSCHDYWNKHIIPALNEKYFLGNPDEKLGSSPPIEIKQEVIESDCNVEEKIKTEELGINNTSDSINDDNSQSNDAAASLDASNAGSHNGSIEDSSCESPDANNTEDSQKSNIEGSDKAGDSDKKGVNLKIFAKGGKGNFIRLEKKDEEDG